ncbi:hypothetical protein BGZ60DRAFT_409714 [Tricladium varicosporioides]|nr:hypothetical protein BGZ60DRAFT_409714 [Hymenoscyphus varicosporioides]
MAKFRAFNIGALATLLLSVANAIVCDRSNVTSVVEDPAGVEATIGDCTTFIGSIFINANFTGVFNLSGITNLTGDVITEDHVDFKECRNLTGIVMDDLVTMGDLLLGGLVSLSTVTLPKLKKAGVVSIGGGNRSSTSLSFPALVKATTIDTFENISSINFPNLTESSLYLSQSRDNPVLNASFPLLAKAENIEILGNIGSLKLWNLTTVANNFTILLTKSIQLDFPKLTSQTNGSAPFTIKPASTLFLPVLQNVGEMYILYESFRGTTTEVASTIVNYRSLTTAYSIYLYGGMSMVQLPKLTKLEKDLIVFSTGKTVDCTSVNSAINRVKPGYSVGTNYKCQTTSEAITIKKGGLTTTLKLVIGICLGVGLAIVLLCVALFVLFRLNKNKKKRNAEKEAHALLPYGSSSGAHDQPHLQPAQLYDSHHVNVSQAPQPYDPHHQPHPPQSYVDRDPSHTPQAYDPTRPH